MIFQAEMLSDFADFADASSHIFTQQFFIMSQGSPICSMIWLLGMEE
jgi:hypothetical protein